MSGLIRGRMMTLDANLILNQPDGCFTSGFRFCNPYYVLELKMKRKTGGIGCKVDSLRVR